MWHQKTSQGKNTDRVVRPAHPSAAHNSRHRHLRNFLLSIAILMIVVSVLPIPMGNASSKSPYMVLEVPLNALRPDAFSQEKIAPSALFADPGEAPRTSGKEKQEADEAWAAQSPDAQSSSQPTVRTITVAEGDSLSLIFNRLQLPMSTLYSVLDAGDDAQRLKHLHPGQTLDFEIGDNRVLKKLNQRVDDTTMLEITLGGDGGGYRSEIITEPLERRTAFAMGAIEQNLFSAGQRVGISDRVIMELVGIFAWDIDFALNVYPGDHFALIYEQFYKDGEKIRDGDILAAEFVNQEQVFRAVQYENDEGNFNYYTPDGLNMKKLFLRTPVEFSRISSRFQLRRWHPILHKFRPHRGVDYAAPRGTPIRATASGKITFVGRKGGLGQAVFIQHGRKYTTVYGHLDKYAKGIKKGKSIRQGHLVGYVGSTGLATGPHLHYEFRVDGVHRDPLTVKLPKAEPIDKRYLADFRKKTRKLLAQLDVLSRTMLVRQPGTPNGKSQPGKS